jgi:hypothetical protein
MPEPELFARGFNLVVGSTIAGHVIDDVRIQEHAKVRYHDYVYTCSVQVRNVSDPDPVRRELNSLTPRIIHSSHGTPYMCTVNVSGERPRGADYIFTLSGEAVKDGEGMNYGLSSPVVSYQVIRPPAAPMKRAIVREESPLRPTIRPVTPTAPIKRSLSQGRAQSPSDRAYRRDAFLDEDTVMRPEDPRRTYDNERYRDRTAAHMDLYPEDGVRIPSGSLSRSRTVVSRDQSAMPRNEPVPLSRSVADRPRSQPRVLFGDTPRSVSDRNRSPPRSLSGNDYRTPERSPSRGMSRTETHLGNQGHGSRGHSRDGHGHFN